MLIMMLVILTDSQLPVMSTFLPIPYSSDAK